MSVSVEDNTFVNNNGWAVNLDLRHDTGDFPPTVANNRILAIRTKTSGCAVDKRNIQVSVANHSDAEQLVRVERNVCMHSGEVVEPAFKLPRISEDADGNASRIDTSCHNSSDSIGPARKQVVRAGGDFMKDIEQSVIENVQHDEQAAWYPPTEASQISFLKWVSWVEQFAAAAAWSEVVESHSGMDDHDAVPDGEAIYLIRFFRRPRGMHEQLASSPALKGCRDDLQAFGYDWKLLCGPSVFVRPSQYVSTVQALPRFGLSNCDVIVNESAEYLLAEALSSIGKGVWAKTREIVSAGGASSSSCQSTSGTRNALARLDGIKQDWHEVCTVKRTLIHVAPSLRNPDSVVQSETNSRMLDIANPRRALNRDLD